MPPRSREIRSKVSWAVSLAASKAYSASSHRPQYSPVSATMGKGIEAGLEDAMKTVTQDI